MLGAARWTLICAVVAGWLVLPGTAMAIVPQVHDNGNFFKAETVKEADAHIKMIAERYKKDVVVDTFSKIPESAEKQFKYSSDNREAFFRAWRDDLAKRADVNGIIVIICRNQHRDDKIEILVAAGGETLKTNFTPHDAEKLTDILADDFAKSRDRHLLDGLKYIENTLSAHPVPSGKAKGNAVIGQTPRSSSGDTSPKKNDNSDILSWVCIGLCVLLGIWLVFGLIRAFSGGGGGGYAGGPGYGYGGGGGGGGFFAGLMGGLFGAMAGNWIYNSMFGGQSYHQSSWGGSTAQAGEPSSGAQDDVGQSDHGEGFAGSSREVDDGGGDGGDGGGGGDDAGGGGDWGGGGGDAGGGDWGGGGDAGGDWGGGGGGDFGGGGGDW